MRKTCFWLLSLFMSLVSLHGHAQEGAWSGALDIQGTKLPLVFHFDSNGCTMDSPSQGAKGIKAEMSYSADGKLIVNVPSIGASFEGVYVLNVITGTFKQGMASLPLTLKPGAPKPKRPQMPKAPFPYTTEEVTFNDGEVVLHGTLTLPENYTKETPVVVMVTGSGQQDRDEELFDHKPFAVIADALAREGIASLRYDDRLWGDNSIPFYVFTTYHFACDASAAVKVMRERFNKVGVLGHSEGGTIAMMLASEGKTDFIVSLAGMAISAKKQMVMQNRAILGASGIPSEHVETYCSALANAFDKLVAGETIENIESPDVPEALAQNFRMALKQCETPWMRHFLSLDVSKDLGKITCPVLALNGKKDLQVDCEANLGTIAKGVKSPHEIVAFDDLNHLFQHCQTGAVTEYQQIEETISPEVLKKITEWINSTTK